MSFGTTTFDGEMTAAPLLVVPVISIVVSLLNVAGAPVLSTKLTSTWKVWPTRSTTRTE